MISGLFPLFACVGCSKSELKVILPAKFESSIVIGRECPLSNDVLCWVCQSMVSPIKPIARKMAMEDPFFIVKE